MLASQKFKDRILDSYKSGNYSIVEQDATYLISKGFTDPWLCNLLAVSLAKQKKFFQAIKYFEILCQLNPNDSDNFFNLGNLYRDAKNPDLAIGKVLRQFEDNAISIDRTDGISLNFENWRFNLRKSNTEPLVRLNVEVRGNLEILPRLITSITKLIDIE